MKATIEQLAADQMVATDEGTHGMPQTIRVFETLDGRRYAITYHGSSPISRTSKPEEFVSVHGRMRWLQSESPAERRALIGQLRDETSRTRDAAAKREAHVAKLRQGWDGYQFVGEAEGQRRAAAMA